MIKVCKHCGVEGRAGLTFPKKGLTCTKCGNAIAKTRMAERRRTPEYKKWLDESRELRRKLKEKYRRQAGCRSRSEIKAAAAKRRAEINKKLQLKKEERELKKENRLSVADKFRLRYRSDPDFAAKQRKRTSETKKKVPYWYANQLMGGTSSKQYPPELVLTKQVQKRIDNLIKEMK